MVDDPLLMIVVYRALRGVDKACAHSYAGCAESERRGKTVTVGNAAGCDDGDAHVSRAAACDDEGPHAVGGGMTADLIPGDYYSVEPLALHAHGYLIVRALVHMDHARALDVGDKLSGIVCRGFNSRDVLFAAEPYGLSYFLRVQTLSRSQRYVDDKRLAAGESVHLLKRVAELLKRGPTGHVDGTDAAGIADSGGKLRYSEPLHTALYDRVLDAKEFCEFCFHCFSSIQFLFYLKDHGHKPCRISVLTRRYCASARLIPPCRWRF